MMPGRHLHYTLPKRINWPALLPQDPSAILLGRSLYLLVGCDPPLLLRHQTRRGEPEEVLVPGFPLGCPQKLSIEVETVPPERQPALRRTVALVLGVREDQVCFW
jgi:hypothetical protein